MLSSCVHLNVQVLQYTTGSVSGEGKTASCIRFRTKMLAIPVRVYAPHGSGFHLPVLPARFVVGLEVPTHAPTACYMALTPDLAESTVPTREILRDFGTHVNLFLHYFQSTAYFVSNHTDYLTRKHQIDQGGSRLSASLHRLRFFS